MQVCSISHRLTDRHDESFRTDHSFETTTWWLLYVATLWHLHSVIVLVSCRNDETLFSAAAHTQKNWSFSFVTCTIWSKLHQAAIVHVLFLCRHKFFMLFTPLLLLKDHSVLSFSSPALAWMATAAKSGEREVRVARSDIPFSSRSGEIHNTAATEQSAAEACSAIKAATI